MQQKMRDFSILKKRILQYLDYKGISKYEFYQLTGVSNGVLSQKNGFSEENILRVLSVFGELSPEWLITGDGDMLKSSSNISPSGAPVPSPAQTDQSPGTGCPLCKDKDERIKDLKETIDILKENIKSLGNSFKISIETQQSVIHQLQDQIDDLQQQHFDTDDTITSQAG
jgi:hypothetical protein